ARHDEGAIVSIDRRADLHAPACTVAGDEESVRSALRGRSVVRVEVEGSDRRELEVIGGERSMARIDQVVGDQLMQAQALSFRQAGVCDVFQCGVADRSACGWPAANA